MNGKLRTGSRVVQTHLEGLLDTRVKEYSLVTRIEGDQVTLIDPQGRRQTLSKHAVRCCYKKLSIRQYRYGWRKHKLAYRWYAYPID